MDKNENSFEELIAEIGEGLNQELMEQGAKVALLLTRYAALIYDEARNWGLGHEVAEYMARRYWEVSMGAAA
ncbi:hypothetical protein [Embleya hyalina]|uniref:Uncharacterized protein n=1 Tax=Embleya hyalina TaxID=516124 RepID=A0A401YYY8_9ACTN|nr:hypothetical protein [Embleya hyalina]GCD99836.1 hypothetical protein EHYA_07558 [Embleya hyalina]